MTSARPTHRGDCDQDHAREHYTQNSRCGLRVCVKSLQKADAHRSGNGVVNEHEQRHEVVQDLESMTSAVEARHSGERAQRLCNVVLCENSK